MCTKSQYKCGDECIETHMACNGVCPTPGNSTESFFKCPFSEVCFLPSKMCDFALDTVLPLNMCFEDFSLTNMVCKYDFFASASSFKCDGVINYLNRSDESLCPEKEGHDLDYSMFIDCEQHDTKGFKCGEHCLPYELWCNNGNTRFTVYEKKCPSLLKTSNNEKLCKNFTFWKNRPCNFLIDLKDFIFISNNKSLELFDEFFDYFEKDFREKELIPTRCTGNYPGHCQICDKSNYIADFDFNFGHTIKCHDNITFVHEELWCDGYIQCPDGSDEDPKECGNCQRTYGFPKNKISATFSCKHKYTRKPICAIPCDGKDDQCLDDIDEHCTSATITSTMTFGIVLVIVSVFAVELYNFYMRITKCYKTEAFEKKVASSIGLLNKLKGCLECPTKYKKTFGSFKKWHGKEQYPQDCNTLAYALMVMEKGKAQDIAQLFFKLENKYHHGNKASIHICMRRNFGTNSTTKHLFELIKPSTEESNSFTKLIWNTILKFLKSPFVEYMGFLLLVPVKIFAYYTDMYKDIYMLVEYSKFVPIENMKFSSFAFQVFIILSISVTLPMILNWFTLINARVQSRIAKVEMLVVSPLVPAFAVYFISKLNFVSYRIKKTCQNNKKPESTNTTKSINKICQNDYLVQQGTNLLSDLRSNENATEHLIQSLVLIILIAVKFTQSRTVSGFQELLAGGNTLFLLGLSATFSIFSIITGKVQQNLAKKQHSVPFTGIMIQISYSILAMACRIFAVVLYFAPAMGLFNLQMHWKIGNFQQKFYVITENGTLNEVVWKPIHHYEELTSFQLDVYYISFLLLIPFHFLLVAAIKLLISKEFKSRKDYWKKILHVIHQGNLNIIHQGDGMTNLNFMFY